jgi:hypothetical protein
MQSKLVATIGVPVSVWARSHSKTRREGQAMKARSFRQRTLVACATALADGQTHAADLVSIFCMPPTFDPVIDGATDLPGPGAVMLQGEVQLQ